MNRICTYGCLFSIFIIVGCGSSSSDDNGGGVTSGDDDGVMVVVSLVVMMVMAALRQLLQMICKAHLQALVKLTRTMEPQSKLNLHFQATTSPFQT